MVFKYQLRPPTTGDDLVADQIRSAHQYRNTLMEIERAARASLREAELNHGLRDAREALLRAKEANSVALAAWKDAGKPKGDLADAASAAYLALGEARKTFTRERSLARGDECKAEQARVAEERSVRMKAARADTTVFWGTYLPAEQAHKSSLATKDRVTGRPTAIPLWRDGEPADPRFKSWTGDGSVSVQLQGYVTALDLFRGTSFARIERVPMRTTLGKSGQRPDPTSNRSKRRESSNYVLWMRVSSEGRDPVWAKFPMVMHRQMPPDARVTWVAAHRRRVGSHDEWHATFTCTMPRGHVKEADRPRGRGVVAVEVGWRVVPEGLRIATWRDEEGRKGHVVLPNRMISSIEMSAGLRATRTNNFNEAIAAFAAYMRGGTTEAADVVRHEVPAWLREAIERRSIERWRSPERLHGIVRRWAREAGVVVSHEDYLAWERPPVDRWTLRDLELWRYHEHHLYDFERGQDRNARAARKEFYLAAAIDLARRYEVLVHEDFDIGRVAEKPKTREKRKDAFAQQDVSEHAGDVRARSNRFVAAPSEFRELLKGAFVSRGKREYGVNAFKNTQRCNSCGSEEPWDAAPKITHTCSGCRATWDQDVNHCANMLALFAGTHDEIVSARAADDKARLKRKADKDARIAARKREAEVRRAAEKAEAKAARDREKAEAKAAKDAGGSPTEDGGAR